MLPGPWSLTKLGLTRMSTISIILEAVRWGLQTKFPALLHPVANGAPYWTRAFFAVQTVFWLAASGAAGGHLVDAIKTRSWKNLNLLGIALYLAWWVETGCAGGYLTLPKS